VPDETRRNCRSAAVVGFGLDEAVRRYCAIYDTLGAPHAEAPIEAEVG
jgi:hypothetical protein